MYNAVDVDLRATVTSWASEPTGGSTEAGAKRKGEHREEQL